MFVPFLLALEFLSFYIALPLLIANRVIPNWPIPYLLAVALTAFIILLRDPSFDSRWLCSTKGIAANLRWLLLRDFVLLAILGLAVRIFAPQLLFGLIKHRPLFWVLIMIFYPLVSVYPQELLYRAFFFHRYRPLFEKGWAMVVASACAFGFVHIIFGNWVATSLSTIGGLLFALTYRRSGSLLLACIDHAIFGNFIFTIGLGHFFYNGSHL
jgi:uncharacterized protein